MVKKHLFQYGDNQFHILQLKTKRQLEHREGIPVLICVDDQINWAL